MMNSALLETLAAFSDEERADFQRFVHSDYSNDGPHAAHCTALWQHLNRYAPRFEHPDLEPGRVYVKVFPGKSWVKGKLDVVMSKLHQVAKMYIARQIMANHDALPESLRLAAFFRQRGLHRRAAALLEKYREEQAQNQIHGAEYWQNGYQLELEQHLLDTDLQNHHHHQALSAALLSNHHAHLILLLTHLNALLYARRKNPVPDVLAERLALSIPDAIAIVDLSTEPLLRLLYTAFRFVRDPDAHHEGALRLFLQDIENELNKIPLDARRDLYTYARSHCSWHFNRGRSEFASLNLAIFKTCFERGLLFDRGKIQGATYMNMVQAGLIAGDYEWLKKVMPSCQKRIIGVPHPEGLYQYTLANMHYHLQEHDRALELLRGGSDDLFNNLMARKLELKIYYETDSPLLEAKIENFKLFVFRQGKKHLTEDVFLMNNHFIDLFRGMVNAFGNAEKAKKLLDKASVTTLLAERAWLLEQLARLLK